jgi:hypothetical protein
MQRGGIVVSHGALARDAQLVAVARAQERVQLRVPHRQLPAVRERDQRGGGIAVRPQLEEAVETAKPLRRLSAAELAAVVGDGEQAVAEDAAFVDLDLVDLLAEK